MRARLQVTLQKWAQTVTTPGGFICPLLQKNILGSTKGSLIISDSHRELGDKTLGVQ